MITSVEHRKYETWHVDDWDRLLDYILDEETKKLILNVGVSHLADDLDKGSKSQYVVETCNIRHDGWQRDPVLGEITGEVVG